MKTSRETNSKGPMQGKSWWKIRSEKPRENRKIQEIPRKTENNQEKSGNSKKNHENQEREKF